MLRRKPLRRERSAPRKSGRVLWPEYLDEVRKLPCYVCGRPGPSDPDHQGPHPYGRKADDDTAVPLDRWCHQMRTDGYIYGEIELKMCGGVVRTPGWKRSTKEEMRDFCDEAIAKTQSIVLPILAARDVKNPKEEA